MSATIVLVGSQRIHESKHTKSRPPCLVNDNFPSTQANGPTNEPTPPVPPPSTCRSLAGIDHDLKDLSLERGVIVAQYPPSLDTDSTWSAGTCKNQDHRNQDLQNQVDSIEWRFNNSHCPAQQQRLTSLALQALNHRNNTLGYHRDLAGWCRDGNMFIRGQPEPELSDSMLIPQRARSQFTDLTGSSWSMLSDLLPPQPADDTAEDVSGTGAAFHDIPRLHADAATDMMMALP